jgi:hypothetical protein
MSRRRLLVVYGLLAMLLCGHLYDAARRQEHWPFSNYAMFAAIAQPDLTTYQFIGLTQSADGSSREIAVDWHAIPVLPAYKLQSTLRHYDRTDRPKLQRLLHDYLDTYEARRKLGLHDGPPLVALRLYLVHIPIQLPPVTADLKTARWSDARLVMEVSR